MIAQTGDGFKDKRCRVAELYILKQTMSISNKSEPIQDLPSVLGYISTVLNRKSKTEDEHHQKFRFTSDLIFGHLVDEKRKHLEVADTFIAEKSVEAQKLPVRSFTSSYHIDVPTKVKALPLDNMKTNPIGMGTQKKLPAKANHNSTKKTSRKFEEPVHKAERKFSIDDILGYDRKELMIKKEDCSEQIVKDKDLIISNQNNKHSARSGLLNVNIKIEPASDGLDENESTLLPPVHHTEEKLAKLPNISQFFEPIDKIIDFKECAASRCEVNDQDKATSSWLARATTNSTMFPGQILDFPVLRNTGRLEFHRSPFTLLGDRMFKTQEKKNIKFQPDITIESIKLVKGSTTLTEPTANSMEIKSTTSLIDENNKPSSYAQPETSEQNAKGFRCEKCGKIYCRKYVLKIHMRTHSGEKPLKCQICGKCFSDPSNMKKHVKLHETDHVTYPCKFCGRNFVRRRGLLNHLHSMHSRFPVVHSQV